MRSLTTRVLLPWLMLCGQVNAELTQQLRWDIALSDGEQRLQKSRLTYQPQWQTQAGATRFTLIPRLALEPAGDVQGYVSGAEQGAEQRPDSYPRGDINLNGPLWWHAAARAELAEAYADSDINFFGQQWSLRSGKQQVAWGQADGFRVLDIINPQDLREFNLPNAEDYRLPLWMLNAQLTLNNDQSLQLLLIPDLTFNEQANTDSPFAITSQEMAPQSGQSPLPITITITINRVKRPAQNNPEVALRWSAFINGWDLSASYFSFYHDNAVIFRRLNTNNNQPTSIDVQAQYRRAQLLGFSGSNAFGSWVLRFEAAHVSRSFFLRDDLTHDGIQQSPEWQQVTGLDYQGVSNTLLSYQFYLSHISTYDPAVIRARDNIRHTLMLKHNLLNDTLELRFFTLLNRDYNDGQNRAQITWQVNDQWSLWGGADHFFGNRAGPFGQFSDASRFVLGSEYSF